MCAGCVSVLSDSTTEFAQYYYMSAVVKQYLTQSDLFHILGQAKGSKELLFFEAG
jgi:hypothetical protein